jgi:CheY-like chemotaxis protein
LRLAARTPLVLVVDADDDSRALMRRVLEISGLIVVECHEGERVVDEVARLRPDLIVLEELLPHVDGRMACRQLRRAAGDIRHTPVIFTSSSSSPSSARLAFEAGCTLYFTKPFDIEELMRAATELVKRPRA